MNSLRVKKSPQERKYKAALIKAIHRLGAKTPKGELKIEMNEAVANKVSGWIVREWDVEGTRSWADETARQLVGVEKIVTEKRSENQNTELSVDILKRLMSKK